MSQISVYRRDPDGNVVQVTVKAKDSYPDCLRELKRTALDGFKEAHDMAWMRAEVDEQP